jgi:hypothetical protein
MIPVSAPEKVSDEDGDPALRPGGARALGVRVVIRPFGTD